MGDVGAVMGADFNRREPLLGTQDEAAEGRITMEGNSQETFWR